MESAGSRWHAFIPVHRRFHHNHWKEHGQRTRWSDAKIQRVENLIADFVAGLLRTSVSLRRQAEKRKLREVEERKRAEERTQLQKQIEEEEKKLEQLNKWIECWERANRMRLFIAAYAEKSRSWPAEKRAQHDEWIVWANQQAERIDPLITEKPASVLDRKHELRWW